MVNFTSNTYQMKREILSFSNKISKKLPKPERKFIADMNYGILASRSCLLTDIVDQLHEPSRKINIVDRLSRHLAKGTSKDALKAYLALVKKWCPDQPVIHIDDSDVVKPDGYKFESLGLVRDGSASTFSFHWLSHNLTPLLTFLGKLKPASWKSHSISQGVILQISRATSLNHLPIIIPPIIGNLQRYITHFRYLYYFPICSISFSADKTPCTTNRSVPPALP